MTWDKKWSQHVGFTELLAQQGQRIIPPKPELKPEYLWLREAYVLLSRSRQVGMSEFYIPLTEYAAYLDIIQLDNNDQRTFLVSVLTQVDAITLSEQYEEARKKTEDTKKSRPK